MSSSPTISLRVSVALLAVGMCFGASAIAAEPGPDAGHSPVAQGETKVVSGMISQVDATTVHIEVVNSDESVPVEVDDRTDIYVDGQQSDVDNLRPGMAIAARVPNTEDRQAAVTIFARNTPATSEAR